MANQGLQIKTVIKAVCCAILTWTQDHLDVDGLDMDHCLVRRMDPHTLLVAACHDTVQSGHHTHHPEACRTQHVHNHLIPDPRKMDFGH